jgi:hypothetical protein
MASVLAIVSKAVFEKMVAKDVALGTIVATDRYVSSHKTFESLAEGGALFLVTVRPPDEHLWLVGILENPKKKGDAWVAAKNTTALTDITGAIAKLQFTSGAGLKPKKGALGMSLQTSRLLTDGDVQLLRDMASPSAKAAYMAAVDAVVHQPAGTARLGKFRLENKRKPFAGKLEDLKDFEKQQLQAVVGKGVDLRTMFGKEPDGEEGSELVAMEIADVVDTRSGATLYQLMLWPYGDGTIVANASTEVVSHICQHGLDPVAEIGKAWMRDFARAWVEGSARLGMWRAHIDFSAEVLGEEADDD